MSQIIIQDLSFEYYQWSRTQSATELYQIEREAWKKIQEHIQQNPSKEPFWWQADRETKNLIRYLVGVKEMAPIEALKAFGCIE